MACLALLITVAEKIGAVVPSGRRPTQINKIMDVLYKEKTRDLETNMELLYATIRSVIKQRSLVVFFTKKLIVKELAKYNIQSILTRPQNLTINTINRYLELKAKQKI